jgi:hypothetical protein
MVLSVRGAQPNGRRYRNRFNHQITLLAADRRGNWPKPLIGLKKPVGTTI